MLSPSDLTHITDSYAPLGRKIGSETEYLVTHSDGSPLCVEQSAILEQSYAAQGLSFSREIYAGIFESKTSAYDVNHIDALFHENDSIDSRMNKVTSAHHMMMSGDSFDPDLTLDQALTNRIPHPRADGLIRRLREDGHSTVAKHCVMTSSIHLSLGYDSFDDALRTANLASRLTPLLTLLTENNQGRFEGRKFDGHVMAALRHAQGARTNIQKYFYDAVNGNDFIKRHINHITNVPAMMYADERGEAQVFPTFDNKGFNDLAAAGLNNRDNYFLIEKMQYNDVKIAAIFNAERQVKGHRIELRMADRGAHQHDSMVIIGAMIADKTMEPVLESFLTRFGYGKNDPQCYANVCVDLNAAIYHGGKHLNSHMASGVTFRDMAREFGDIIKTYVENMPLDVAKRAETLLNICATGVNEAQYKKSKQAKGLVKA